MTEVKIVQNKEKTEGFTKMSTTSDNYDLWMGQELKKLIDLISSRVFQHDQLKIREQIAEIQRGIDYGTNNPGSINDLLLKLSRNFIDSLEVYLRQMRPRSTPGIPPGGQPTVLVGDFEGTQSSQFNVDELKGALASRKKKSVESKMKGSINLLRDYEEG